MDNKSFITEGELLNLQLFADGGEGGNSTADGQTGVTPTDAGSDKGDKQTAAHAADGQNKTTAQSAEERAAAFEKLIKGDYKDLYDARVQDTIQRRLKEQKGVADKYNALSPVLKLLGDKYGIDANDSAALAKAIEEDDSYFEDEAMKRGITVDELRKEHRMKKENDELREKVQAYMDKEHREQTYMKWMNEAKAAKEAYPDFDIKTEAKNEQFTKLLNAGIDVKTAYEVIHMNDVIIPREKANTARAVEEKLTNKVLANGARPQENGSASGGATLVKPDVSKMTKAQRAEINRRAAMGERITLSQPIENL